MELHRYFAYYSWVHQYSFPNLHRNMVNLLKISYYGCSTFVVDKNILLYESNYGFQLHRDHDNLGDQGFIGVHDILLDAYLYVLHDFRHFQSKQYFRIHSAQPLCS